MLELYGYRNSAPQRLWTAQQQIESEGMRDHQDRHVDDRDSVGCAQLPGKRWKADLDCVVVIEGDVRYSYKIEGDDERPKERTNPCCEERQKSQHSSCEVPVGGKSSKAGRQIGAYDAWKDKDESEKAEAVYSTDDTVCFESVHRPELR